MNGHVYSADRLASENGDDDHRAPIIALLNSKKLLMTRFRHVCTQQASKSSSTGAKAPDVPVECWRLKAACNRVFVSSIVGIAGRFTRQQLSDLHKCAGTNGIAYITRDNQVKKAEGEQQKRWWTYRPPTNMTLEQLQRLAASKLGKAAAEGVSGGISKAQATKSAADATGVKTQSPPSVQANDGPAQPDRTVNGNSSKPTQAAAINAATLEVIQRWILAEVGLAAQQQLSQPRVQAVTVRASDGAQDARALPLEHAAVAEDGVGAQDEATVSAQPRGSKNQDPGILVDVAAVSRPDIRVQTAGDKTLDTSSPQDLQQPLAPAAAERANEEPGVKQQRLVTALWNLDRIDQQKLPLTSTFSYGSPTTPGTGKGVTMYLLDSGIRKSHQEFAPWDGSSTNRITVGPDFVDDDGAADDCDGHGTHVASTAAGRSVGVAKEAHVVALRVLDCDGAGSISNVVAGLDWVAQNAVKPAVVSLSLGVPAGKWSQPMEDAIKHLTDVVGIPVVVAAGNSAKDSCGVAPARVPSAITVAASNLPTKFGQTRADDIENLYSWSNTGACVKLFAPGVDIYAACGGASRCATLNDSSYTWASGTSMAAPHVTGAIAVYLEQNPTATPSQVMAALVAAASTGHLTDKAMLPGTPNKLLFTSQQ